MTSVPSASPTVEDGAVFMSAQVAAREFVALSRSLAAAFVAFGPSPSPGLAVTARILGEHAQSVAALVPESVLLASARASGDAASLVPVIEPATTLAALDDIVAGLLHRASPVADGAFMRLAPRIRADLAQARAGLRSAV